MTFTALLNTLLSTCYWTFFWFSSAKERQSGVGKSTGTGARGARQSVVEANG